MGHLINTLASGLCSGCPSNKYLQWQSHALGKTEVSFQQWHHEVQCVKDHYPESVVWESIVRSLKGSSSRHGQVYGPYCQCLQHFVETVIFGTVALFHVLMQNFYKVTQGNHEKVSSFTTRLEVTLNQIQLKCPRWIGNCEVPWHVKDCLFHGVQNI